MTSVNQLNKEQKHSQLNPVIYPDGTIRLNCRYKNLDLPHETQLSILLPRSNIFDSYWFPTFMKEIVVLESQVHSHTFEGNIGDHKDEKQPGR